MIKAFHFPTAIKIVKMLSWLLLIHNYLAEDHVPKCMSYHQAIGGLVINYRNLEVNNSASQKFNNRVCQLITRTRLGDIISR